MELNISLENVKLLIGILERVNLPAGQCLKKIELHFNLTAHVCASEGSMSTTYNMFENEELEYLKAVLVGIRELVLNHKEQELYAHLVKRLGLVGE